MEAQINEVASTLRSCLITSKNGCPIENLNNDYKMLEGRNIPHRQLGYPTLDLFIQVVPGIRILKKGGSWWVEAVPTKESAHISRLVANQNQSKTQRRRARFTRPAPTRRPQSFSTSAGMRFANIASARNRPANNFTQNSRVTSTNSAPTMPTKVTVYPPKPLMQQPVQQPPLVTRPNSASVMPTKVTVYPPKTLVQPVQQPLIAQPSNGSMTKPRSDANSTVSSSNMIERNIPPQQLDIDMKNRAPHHSMPVTVYSPKKSTAVEVSRTPIQPRQSAEIGAPAARAPSITPLISQTATAKTSRAAQVPASPMTPPTPMTPITPVSTGPIRLWSTAVPRPNLAGTAPTPQLPPAPASYDHLQPLARTRLCDRLVIPTVPQFSRSTVWNGNGSIQVTFNQPAGGEDESITNPREALENIVRRHGLPTPEYKDVSVQSKNGNRGTVYAQVIIGSRKFSSYPAEAKSNSEAELLAATNALATLRTELESVSANTTTTDRALLKTRILLIIDEHNGVFANKIPAYYQAQYKEKLPDDWMEEISKCSEVAIESGAAESTILTRRVSVTEMTSPPPSPKVAREVSGSDFQPIGPGVLPKLELPKEDSWIAYVTLVVSTDEIWVRLVGDDYSDKFVALAECMVKHYTSASYKILDVVQEGEYYALSEDDDCHRVRVIEYDTTSCEATILFIDNGDEDTVTASKLMPLENKFRALPAQAIRVSLAGLEDLADYPNTLDLVLPRIDKMLHEKLFYVFDTNRRTDEDDGPVATVELYDTTGPDDVYVNEKIKTKIEQQLSTSGPKLEEDTHITDAHVSHVENNGDVFVQVKSEGMKFLVKMMNELIQDGISEEDIGRSKINSVDRASVYLVKSAENGEWYRATVIDAITAEGQLTPRIKVFLIDFGRTIEVTPDNLLKLEILNKLLANYTAQATKVRLHDVEPAIIDETTIARLRKLAPPSETLLLKVVQPSCRGSTPVVELFKRSRPDNDLIAINRNLVLEYELFKASGDGNNNVRPRRRLERVNSRASGESDDANKTLKVPKISETGEYFDIRVTMAASPSNFTVQPLNNSEELKQLMGALQETCSAYSGPPPTLESIREGRLYAVCHADGMWYRACISNVVNEQMVTVYFCDYGDVTMVTLDKLQPLLKQFFDLPYQAIKARLVGIQPMNRDWSPEDCVRFQNETVERDFISIVMEKTPDKHSPSDTVLGLKLIDTSTPEDVYIAKLLVDEGRAVYVD